MSQPVSTLSGDRRFEELRRGLALLLETVPRVCDALGASCRWKGREAVEMRYESLEFCRKQGLNPPLTAVLMGPTGAGKSSWFRLLTGVEVPAGGVTRPMTRGCAVAVPDPLCDEAFLTGVFPGYRLARMESPEQLREAAPDDLLFFSPASPPEEGEPGLPLILADVPDFNSVECANWKSAEKMLARAELVVFLVFGESYSDQRTVEVLARCCRSAANLIYLFTKTSPDAAREMRRHLLQLVEEKRELGFHEPRADGRTLLQFLTDARFFCSPLADPRIGPQLQEAVPLVDGGPDLVSWLRGQDGSRLVFLGLLEAVREATLSAKELLHTAKRRREKLKSDLAAMDALVRETAEFVARGVFPAGRPLELAIEEARRQSPPLLRSLAGVMGFFSGTVKAAVRASTDFFAALVGDRAAAETPPVATLEEIEKIKLREAAEKLIDRLRGQFPEAAAEGGMLAAERCDQARRSLLSQELPPPGTDWEIAIRQRLAAWCRENRLLAVALTTIPPTLNLASLGLIAADLGLSGGLFGTTIGSLTGLAASNAAAAWVLDSFGKLKLDSAADQAYRDWVEQRAGELQSFLRKHFAEGLADEWRRTLQELEKIPIDRCLQACEAIESRLQAERDGGQPAGSRRDDGQRVDGRWGAAPTGKSGEESAS